MTSTRSGACGPVMSNTAGYTADDFRIETFRTLAEAFPEHVLDLEIKVPLDNAGENDITYAIEATRCLPPISRNSTGPTR